MAFNFGAFVGGLSTGLATSIKEEEERQFKFDMLAEEEATKMRLQRSAERKAQRAKDRELAGKLSAMGFDKGRVSYIISQGAGYAEGIYDLAAAASAKGNDPNTLFKYTDSMDEFRSFVGPERDGIRGDVDLGKLPTDFDYSTAFTQDQELTTSVLTEDKDKNTREFSNLDELYTYFKEEQFKYAEGSDEYKAIGKKLESIRVDMHEIAKQKDTSETPATDPLISQNQYNNDIKTARAGVSGKYGLKAIEGEFEALETGEQALSQVAEMEAALVVKKGYEALSGESSLKEQGMTRANAAIESRVASLGTVAIQTARAWKSQYEAHIKDNKDPAKFKGNGIAAKWKMPQGTDNFDLKKMIAQAESGNNAELMKFTNFVDGLNYGDIIQVDGRLAVYTGLTHTYDKIKINMPIPNSRGVHRKPLSMPLLFVGNIEPSSPYMYTGIDY